VGSAALLSLTSEPLLVSVEPSVADTEGPLLVAAQRSAARAAGRLQPSQ
jgi:hypothetical protein